MTTTISQEEVSESDPSALSTRCRIGSLPWDALTVTVGTVDSNDVLVASVLGIEVTVLVVAKLSDEVGAISLVMATSVEGEAENAEVAEDAEAAEDAEVEEDVYVERAAATEADEALAT